MSKAGTKMKGARKGKYRRDYPHGAPLGEFGVALPYLLAATHPPARRAVLKYLGTVMRVFFYWQFAVKWGWKKIPVVPVDHPLDRTVPFRPDRADAYLDFICFWLRPFSMMLKTLGYSKGMTYCAEFIGLIHKAYAEAARVYGFRMSTTERPPCRVPKIRLIRLLDPHYLCVPSLHIAIVVLTFSFYRRVFRTEARHFSDPFRARYSAELYDGALEIAETVLYVKQHSVNCIPAALYMMTRLAPELFSVGDAVAFIDRLFERDEDIAPPDRERLAAHIHLLFEQLLLESCFGDDWAYPVRRWLERYGEPSAKPDI